MRAFKQQIWVTLKRWQLNINNQRLLRRHIFSNVHKRKWCFCCSRGVGGAIMHSVTLRRMKVLIPAKGGKLGKSNCKYERAHKESTFCPFVILMRLRRSAFSEFWGANFPASRRPAAPPLCRLTSVYAGGGGSGSSPPSQKQECAASLSMLMAPALLSDNSRL